MGEQSTQYLMKVAIDFGSTNTVMAWRIYEKQEDGKLKIEEHNNLVDPTQKIPTTMALQEDNPHNETVPKNLFGADAVEAFNHSSLPVVLRNNFKQLLYVERPGSPQHEEGVRLTKLFFEYLRELYVTTVLNKLPQYVRSQMEVVLYLTLPVRKTPYHRRLMETVAVEAGFTMENGVNRISSELDEAECVMRYATDQSRPGISKVASKAKAPEGALLLFIDVGGSTMDMTLKRMKLASDGSARMDELSSWPDQDVKYPLGGCLIDEAIKNYLLDHNFAIPDYLEKNWQEGKAKESIRRLKENYNQTLSEGGTIEKLGNQVRDMMFDVDEDQTPPVKYANGPKIDGKNYVDIISKEYIQNMYRAIAELFDEKFQRRVEGMPLTRPEDVDAIFLAGAGSRLFFIPSVLLSPPCGFEKVCQSPDMFFADWKDPSLCCVLGALTDQEGVVSSKFSKYAYYLQYQLYTHAPLLSSRLEKDPTMLSPDKTEYIVDDATYSCRCILNKTILMAEKFAELPVKRGVKDVSAYTDDGNEATLRLMLLRVDDDGNTQPVGVPIVRILGRTISQTLGMLAKLLLTLAPATAAMLGAEGIDALRRMMSGKKTLDNPAAKLVDKYWDKLLSPNKASTIEVGIQAELTESMAFSAKVDVASQYLQGGSKSYEMNL